MYWPTPQQTLKMGHLLIEVTNETTYGEYLLREMKLTNTSVSVLKGLSYNHVLREIHVSIKTDVIEFGQ